jgi:DNA invertase Pin-like site-specific DNA recombinase
MDLTGERSQKITPRHLRRQAYLYVRQSTLRQVVENTESTQRQYALRQRAVALGWPIEQVVVIDRDLGHSGASAADREGFQQLVRDVGLGRAGLVMGLEVSRLARNSTDWHRLLEICALTETLILDEDGLYDPAHFNDRLLLGLKGTMSEAELHVLRARLRGGIVNKARRGELEVPLPVGFVYDAAGRVGLDPDRQVQETLRAFFQTFRRTGSATATVKAFRDQQIAFPRRARYGAHQGETLWGRLEHSRVLWVLHNPRYAGAFFFGRSRHRHTADARLVSERLPREEWTALIPNAHVGHVLPNVTDVFDFARFSYDNVVAEDGHVVAVFNIGVAGTDAIIKIVDHWTLRDGKAISLSAAYFEPKAVLEKLGSSLRSMAE